MEEVKVKLPKQEADFYLSVCSDQGMQTLKKFIFIIKERAAKYAILVVNLSHFTATEMHFF